MSANALARVIDEAMTEFLGLPAAKALQYHIGRMADTGDASVLAIEDPARFDEAVRQLFGQGGTALLDRLAVCLFRSVVPRTRSVSLDYAMPGSYSEKICQLRNMHSIKNAMLGMKDGDHLAVFYSSPFQLEQMICHFVVRGLQNNHVNLMAVSRSEELAFREFLRANGLDVDSFVDSHDIVIVRHDELYPDGLGPSFEPILARLREARVILESRKKAGFNIVGTVAGGLATRGDHDKCIGIEQAWHKTVQDYPVPITLLCPYPAGAITEKSRAPLAECHSRGVHVYA